MHDFDHKDLVVPASPALQGFAEGPFTQLLHGLILYVESAPEMTRYVFQLLTTYLGIVAILTNTCGTGC